MEEGWWLVLVPLKCGGAGAGELEATRGVCPRRIGGTVIDAGASGTRGEATTESDDESEHRGAGAGVHTPANRRKKGSRGASIDRSYGGGWCHWNACEQHRAPACGGR